jgi:hypothetical protein
MDPAVTALGVVDGAHGRRWAAAGLACALSLGGVSALAMAAGLPDPMRPTPGAGGRGFTPTETEAPAESEQPSAAVAARPGDGLRLVSIWQPQGGAARALIGTEWVGAGDRIDGWRVLGVDGEEVRLERGAEKLALRLWPKSLTPQPEPAAAAATARPAETGAAGRRPAGAAR